MGTNTTDSQKILEVINALNTTSHAFAVKLPVLLSSNEIQAQMNLLNIAPNDTNEFYKIKRIMEVPDQLDRIERKLDRLLGIDQEDKE